jgi:hypothetical protein
MPVNGDAQWNTLMSAVEQSADQELEGQAQQELASRDAAAKTIFPDSPVGQAAVRGAYRAGDVANSAAGGVLDAMFQAKDFVVGEPKEADKSQFRLDAERASRERRALSQWNGAVEGIANFVTGFGVVGKVAPVLKGASFAKSTVRGAIVGATMMDPDEQRMSNLVQSYPWLRNPVSAALAAKPEDARWEGRLKNAVESIAMDSVAAGAIVASVKLLRAVRGGDKAAAEAARAEVQAASDKLAQQEADHYERKSFISEEDTAAAQAQLEKGAIDNLNRDAIAQDATGGLNKDFLNAPSEARDLPKVQPGGRAAALEREMNMPADTPEVPGFMGEDGGGQLRPGEAGNAPEGGGAGAPETGPQGATEVVPEGGAVGVRDTLPPGEGGGGGASGPAPGVARPPEANAGTAGNGADAVPTGMARIDQIPAADARGLKPAAAKPLADITPEQVQKSIAKMAADDEAIATHGGVEAALQDGHRFAGGDNIPWQKLHTPDGVREFISSQVNGAIDIVKARKGGDAAGVLRDTKVEKLTEQMGKLFEVDPKLIMGELRRAGDNARLMAVQMETGYRLANSAFIENYEFVRRLDAGNLMGFETREAALEALRQRSMVAMDLYANARSLTSNAARTLRRTRQEFRNRADQMTQVNLAKMDPEMLASMIRAGDGDATVMAKMAKPGVLDRLTDGLIMFRTANILSGPTTQVINMASNVAMLAFRPLSTAVGTYGQEALGAFTKNDVMRASAIATRRAAKTELISTASTIADGIQAFKKAFLMGDSVMAPHNSTEAFEALSGGVGGEVNLLPFREFNTIDDVLANGLRALTYVATADLRLMGSMDEMVKTMRYRGVLMGRAANEADALGIKPGTKAYKDFLRSRADAGFDEAGRAIDADALKEARTTTFQQDLKLAPEDTWVGKGITLGAATSHFTANYPLAKVIVPFIKTPSNLFRYGVKLTPGLNLLQKEYLNALRGAHGEMAQATAMGEMAMGITLLSAAVTLRMNDMVTGSGPQDPKQLKEWKAQGNMPYAVRFGNRQFQINRLDPFQFPVAAAADFVDMYMMHQNKGDLEGLDNLATSLVLTLAHQLKDKTYYKGASDFLDALADDKKMSTWAGRFAPGFIPGVSLLRSLNQDEYLREANGVIDNMKASIPGYSETLPIRYNTLGEPIRVPGRFIGEKDYDSPLAKALDEQFAMTGTSLTPPSSRVNGIDLKDVTLEKSGKNAFEAFNEMVARPRGASETLREALNRIVQTPDYAAAPHGDSSTPNTKEHMVSQVMNSYHEAAMNQLKSENPDLVAKLGTKARDAYNKAMAGRKNLKTVEAHEVSKGLNRLLENNAFAALPTVQPQPLQ